jgi:hypothetical protein
MLRLISILLLFQAASLKGQDTVRTKNAATSKKTYASEKIVLLIEGIYKSSERAFSLFKLNEIVMKDERPMYERGDTLVLTVRVKDKAHPGLLYFQHATSLLYKDRFYLHGQLPAINSAYVSHLEYHKSNNEQPDYVEVKLYGEEYIPSKPLQYRTEVERSEIGYFDLDGVIYTSDEFTKLTFKPGELIFKGHISGKDAIAKYGSEKYAQGVSQFIRKK